jgi:glycosylphosphatidylinositol phospholipase D
MLIWDRSKPAAPTLAHQQDSMNRLLCPLFLLLTAPALSAQAGNSYSGVQEYLDITGLHGSGDFTRHNRIIGAGDVNGDGVDDFLVGIPGSKLGKGKATLYSGARNGDAPFYTELWSETGSRGYGGSAADGFGDGLCALGDINADGYDDFAVSSGNGRYVMLYLGPDGTLLQALVNPSTNASNDYGSALASVDFDGNGIGELVIGDPNWKANGITEKGMIHVYEFTPQSPQSNQTAGGGTGSSSTIVSITRAVDLITPGEIASPDVSIALVAEFAGTNGNCFGSSLCSVATSAGTEYLLVGAPRMEASSAGAIAGGQAFLFRDNPNSAKLDLEKILTIQDGYTSTEPGMFGISVAAVGDLFGNDGTEEFIIGAPGTDVGQIDNGYARVYDVDGNVILTLIGGAAGEGFGAVVAAPGDVDGDQVDDLLVSAPGLNTGPGSVTLLSGLNGSVIETINGTDTSSHFGHALATSGDVDGDGSRDILVSRYSTNTLSSSVHVFRPLHSLPYRITVDATGTGTKFAPIHGVNHGPQHSNTWTKQIGTDNPYLTNKGVDYSDVYTDVNIPNTRIHGEGVGDLNYLWLLDQGIPGDMSRDYDVSDDEIQNLANYDFAQMDHRMDTQEALPGMETIWRIGHDKAEVPGNTTWYAGFREAPNNTTGLAKVAAQVIKHYNDGWGGRRIPTTPIRWVELWNEPYLNFWTGTGTEFGELHVAMLEALDSNFDDDGDGIADGLFMMTPIPPGDPDGWTTEFLDVLKSNWTAESPQKVRIDGAVQHWYTVTPHQFIKKYQGLDTLFTTIAETSDVLKQGENLEVKYPEIWVTEWNRTIEQYADTFASMPFIMNSFYYLNGLYHNEFKRSDGKDFSITLGGAQFYSAKLNLWKKLVDPVTKDTFIVKNHAGLAWEVYGNTLFATASERLATSGSFFEPQMDWTGVLNPIKDFTVMAGRSETQNRIVLVVSSLQLTDMNDHPNNRDINQRLPYVLDVPNLDFTPTSVTRYVQETDEIIYKNGMQAALVAVPVIGSGNPPYAPWELTAEGQTVRIDVGDMIQNTYEVIVIEG